MNERNKLQCLSTKNSSKKEPIRLQSQSALPILDVKWHDYSIGTDEGEIAQTWEHQVTHKVNILVSLLQEDHLSSEVPNN